MRSIFVILLLFILADGLPKNFQNDIIKFHQGLLLNTSSHSDGYNAVKRVYQDYLLYNKLRDRDPCTRYKEMGINLDTPEILKLESDVLMSKEYLSLSLTMDGRSHSPIAAIIECTVRTNNRSAFSFFVLLIPRSANVRTNSNFDIIPAYLEAATLHTRTFAIGDVFDFQLLELTYKDNFSATFSLYLEYEASAQKMTELENRVSRKFSSRYAILSGKIFFGRYILALDSKKYLDLPAVLAYKVRLPNGKLDYAFFVIIFDGRGTVDPFSQKVRSADGDLYPVLNARKAHYDMWVFAVEDYLVDHSSNALPPFLTNAGL